MALPAVNGGACTGLHSSNASRRHALEAPIDVRYPISTCGRPDPIPWILTAGPFCGPSRGHADAKSKHEKCRIGAISASVPLPPPTRLPRAPWRLLYHAYPSRSLDFTVRCRDVSDGRLGGHSGEAVVECDVERWGSEALYTS